MPIASNAEQRAVAAAIASWAAKADARQTGRDHETAPDGWRKHWAELAELGLFSVALPPAAGGVGGSVTDLAVMLEAAADALVPGPVLPTALAGLLLVRGEAPAGRALTAELAAGRTTGAVATACGSLCAVRNDDGSLTVSGTVAPVLGADPQSALILAAQAGEQDVWFFLHPQVATVTELVPADFTRSLAGVRLNDVLVPADQVLVGVDTATVRNLAAVLSAAEACGVAGWCLRTAVEYAKIREQFGKPIGSFQAVKHLCAEMLCRVELATALAWDAATAADEGADDSPDHSADQLPLAAALTASVVFDAAVETAKDCIQVLGGIGFTWEHDAHLYLRRAMVLRQLQGGASWRRAAAQLTMAGERRRLRIDLSAHPIEERAAVRAQVRQIAALPVPQQRGALAECGYLAPHWPRPYGLDADAALQLIIDQELATAGVSRPDLVIGGWAIPTILQHGTAAQIERFVAPTLRGELVWCQLFSEPGAGSDLAAVRTKAQPVPGGWRLSGQKVWTSVARQADWGICLARTDPQAPKHRGISYFLVDMRSPGIDVRPLREITGEALFNEVFIDDVFVPDGLVVGAVNDGWKLARTTLGNERVAMAGGSSLGEPVEGLVELATQAASLGGGAPERLGALIAQGVGCSLLDVRAALRRLDGLNAGPESSVRKLVGVRHRQAVAEAALELLGDSAVQDSAQLHAFLQARCLTIAGGTTQVLLTLAAERILGLPRK